jgi:hypothetical protein
VAEGRREWRIDWSIYSIKEFIVIVLFFWVLSRHDKSVRWFRDEITAAAVYFGS